MKLISRLLCDYGNAMGIRIFNLVHSGHYNIADMRVVSCQAYVDNDVTDVDIYNIKCVASMKKKLYFVRLCFRHDNKAYVRDGCHCNCKKGAGQCSHIGGFLALMYLLHKNNSILKLDDWKNYVPIESVLDLITYAIPFSIFKAYDFTNMDKKNIIGQKKLTDSSSSNFRNNASSSSSSSSSSNFQF